MYFKTSVANVEMPLNIAGWSILPDSSPCSVSLLSISVLYDGNNESACTKCGLNDSY